MTATTPRQLTYAEARKRVLAAAPLLPAEQVAQRAAVGRALRETITAPHALPPFRNSAMDGYAVRVADLTLATPTQPVTLRVAQVLPAGVASTHELQAGEAARIMTGAMLPEGADAIVPFEEAERLPYEDQHDERCIIRRASRLGDHVRAAGADIAAGAVVAAKGRELTAYDLALLASLGVAHVNVGRVPRVAVFSTGDELLDIDAPLRPGAIRDSNMPMLSQLVEAAGCIVSVAERLPDDVARVTERVRAAFEASDAVLTIGGVSAGDYDPVKLALESLGNIELWRVAMRPGRPQAFGTPGGKLFFGLPGNPASVACVFEVLVRPALRAMQGHAIPDRPRVPVRVGAAVESRAGRTDFVRSALEWRDGSLWATPVGAQISGHLVPQAQADALLVVPESAERMSAGDAATAIVWRMVGGA